MSGRHPTDLVLVRVRREFDAAHQLPYHDGKCARLHGHRWKVEVGLLGVPHEDGSGPASGMVADFGPVKAVLDELLPDHYSMNLPEHTAGRGMSVPDDASWWPRGIDNPTCERVVRVLYDALEPRIAKRFPHVALLYVRLWETPNGDAQYPPFPGLNADRIARNLMGDDE